MARRGRRALTPDEVREVVDLYAWGMAVWMIGAFYDIHKRTVKEYVKKVGGKVRSSGRSRYLCYPSDARSIQRRIRADAVSCSDPFEDAYRSAREHARELQDKHIAQRLVDASTRSCQAEAS
jgi:hypothetical protein